MRRIIIEDEWRIIAIFRGELGRLTYKPTLKSLNSGLPVFWEREILKDGRYDGLVRYKELKRDEYGVVVQIAD